MRDRRFGVIALVLCLVSAGWSISRAAEPEKSAGTSYPGITRPSEERNLVFNYGGVVREVFVKEGDKVTAGQKLIHLDDRIDVQEWEKAKIDAQSDIKIKISELEAAQKAVQYKRTQELAAEHNASQVELENGMYDAELAKARLVLSREESEQKKLDAEKSRIKVELAMLTSPIDGIVRKINTKEGEYADPQQGSTRPACVVVKNDPLKIEVYLPTHLAAKLKQGDTLQVEYLGEDAWQNAAITVLDPVADAGSQMRRVEAALPNPQNRDAGWQVNVRVPGQ